MESVKDEKRVGRVQFCTGTLKRHWKIHTDGQMDKEESRERKTMWINSWESIGAVIRYWKIHTDGQMDKEESRERKTMWINSWESIGAVIRKSIRCEGQELWCSRISHIEQGALSEMPALEWLYLHSNHLKTLESATFTEILGTLQVLDIHGNPLTCSCRLVWLADWVNGPGSDVLNLPRRTRCKSRGNTLEVAELSYEVLRCGRGASTSPAGSSIWITLILANLLLTPADPWSSKFIEKQQGLGPAKAVITSGDVFFLEVCRVIFWVLF
ncbi:FLRT1 [Cordylochernes scorpioides]|uniref:FLRT1 n=1 Tax=Cordylochernes scorpioides TaxID=51811 RepID=A0ABY6L8U8_9ARAC|nr:FLRT1 [Cordylochernes scorpioides]